MTDRSRHQSNQKTGNARRGNANAGIQAGNNFRNLPLNNAINKIAKTVTKVGTTSVNQVSKPKVDNLPKINTSNVPKSPLERLGLENRAFSGGFNYNVKDFHGKTSGTAGINIPLFKNLNAQHGGKKLDYHSASYEDSHKIYRAPVYEKRNNDFNNLDPIIQAYYKDLYGDFDARHTSSNKLSYQASVARDKAGFDCFMHPKSDAEAKFGYKYFTDHIIASGLLNSYDPVSGSAISLKTPFNTDLSNTPYYSAIDKALLKKYYDANERLAPYLEAGEFSKQFSSQDEYNEWVKDYHHYRAPVGNNIAPMKGFEIVNLNARCPYDHEPYEGFYNDWSLICGIGHYVTKGSYEYEVQSQKDAALRKKQNIDIAMYGDESKMNSWFDVVRKGSSLGLFDFRDMLTNRLGNPVFSFANTVRYLFSSGLNVYNDKQYRKELFNFADETKNHFLTHYINPIKYHNWTALGLNALNEMGDDLDAVAIAPKAAISNFQYVGGDHHLIRHQKAWWSSLGKDRQKALYRCTDIARLLQLRNRGVVNSETRAYIDALKSAGLWKDYQQFEKEYNKDYSAFDTFTLDNINESLNKAYTTNANYNYDTGNIVADIFLEMITDPTVFFTGGTGAIAKGTTKGIVKKSIVAGTEKYISNIDKSLAGVAKTNAAKEFIIRNINGTDSRFIKDIRNHLYDGASVDTIRSTVRGYATHLVENKKVLNPDYIDDFVEGVTDKIFAAQNSVNFKVLQSMRGASKVLDDFSRFALKASTSGIYVPVKMTKYMRNTIRSTSRARRGLTKTAMETKRIVKEAHLVDNEQQKIIDTLTDSEKHVQEVAAKYFSEDVDAFVEAYQTFFKTYAEYSVNLEYLIRDIITKASDVGTANSYISKFLRDMSLESGEIIHTIDEFRRALEINRIKFSKYFPDESNVTLFERLDSQLNRIEKALSYVEDDTTHAFIVQLGKIHNFDDLSKLMSDLEKYEGVVSENFISEVKIAYSNFLEADSTINKYVGLAEQRERELTEIELEVSAARQAKIDSYLSDDTPNVIDALMETRYREVTESVEVELPDIDSLRSEIGRKWLESSEAVAYVDSESKKIIAEWEARDKALLEAEKKAKVNVFKLETKLQKAKNIGAMQSNISKIEAQLVKAKKELSDIQIRFDSVNLLANEIDAKKRFELLDQFIEIKLNEEIARLKENPIQEVTRLEPYEVDLIYEQKELSKEIDELRLRVDDGDVSSSARLSELENEYERISSLIDKAKEDAASIVRTEFDDACQQLVANEDRILRHIENERHVIYGNMKEGIYDSESLSIIKDAKARSDAKIDKLIEQRRIIDDEYKFNTNSAETKEELQKLEEDYQAKLLAIDELISETKAEYLSIAKLHKHEYRTLALKASKSVSIKGLTKVLEDLVALEAKGNNVPDDLMQALFKKTESYSKIQDIFTTFGFQNVVSIKEDFSTFGKIGKIKKMEYADECCPFNFDIGAELQSLIHKVRGDLNIKINDNVQNSLSVEVPEAKEVISYLTNTKSFDDFDLVVLSGKLEEAIRGLEYRKASIKYYDPKLPPTSVDKIFEEEIFTKTDEQVLASFRELNSKIMMDNLTAKLTGQQDFILMHEDLFMVFDRITSDSEFRSIIDYLRDERNQIAQVLKAVKNSVNSEQFTELSFELFVKDIPENLRSNARILFDARSNYHTFKDVYNSIPFEEREVLVSYIPEVVSSDVLDVYNALSSVLNRREDNLLNILSSLNDINNTLTMLNRFDAFRANLKIPSLGLSEKQQAIILDVLFNYSGANPEHFYRIGSNFNESYMQRVDTMLNTLYGKESFSLDRFRQEALNFDSDIYARFIDELDESINPETARQLKNDIQSILSGGHEDPLQDVKVQILQFILKDPEAISILNSKAATQPVIFMDLETQGLNTATKEVTSVACKQWHSNQLSENAPLQKIVQYLLDDNPANTFTYQTFKDREFIKANVEDTVLALGAGKDKSIGYSREELLDAYCKRFGTEANNGVEVTENDLMGALMGYLDNLSAGKKRFSMFNRTPVILTHNNNGFDFRFIQARANATQQFPSRITNLDELVSKQMNTYTRLKNLEGDDVSLTYEQKQEVQKLMGELSRGVADCEVGMRFLNPQALDSAFKQVTESIDIIKITDDLDYLRNIKHGSNYYSNTCGDYTDFAELFDYIIKANDSEEYKTLTEKLKGVSKRVHEETSAFQNDYRLNRFQKDDVLHSTFLDNYLRDSARINGVLAPTLGYNKIIDRQIVPKFFESDIIFNQKMSINDYTRIGKFSKEVNNTVVYRMRGTEDLEKYLVDLQNVIRATKKFAERLGDYDPMRYLAYLKVPDNVDEAFVVAQKLYNMIYKYTDTYFLPQQMADKNLRVLSHLPKEEQAAAYAVRLFGTDFNILNFVKDKEVVTDLLSGNWDHLYYKDVMSPKYVDKTLDKHVTKAISFHEMRHKLFDHIGKNRRAMEEFKTNRLYSESSSTRDYITLSAEEDLADIVENMQKLEARTEVDVSTGVARNITVDNEYMEVFKQYLQHVYANARRSYSTQILEAVSKDESSLIAHLLHHKHIMVVPLKGNELHVKQVDRLLNVLYNADKRFVKYTVNGDGFIYAYIPRESRIRIIDANRKKGLKQGFYFSDEAGKQISDVFYKPDYKAIQLDKVSLEELKAYEEAAITKLGYKIPFNKAEKEAYRKIVIDIIDRFEHLFNHKLLDMTEGKCAGSLGVLHNLSYHQSLIKSLPLDVKNAMIDAQFTCDSRLWHSSDFDFSILGDTENCYKFREENNPDLLRTIFSSVEELAARQQATRLIITEYFSKTSELSFAKTFAGLEYDTVSRILNDNRDMVLCVLVKGSSDSGYLLKTIKITDEASFEVAKTQDAIVLPYDVYVSVAQNINTGTIDNKFLQVLSQYVALLKTGQMMSPGTWIRNWIDSTLKIYGESDSLVDVFAGQCMAFYVKHHFTKIMNEIYNLSKNSYFSMAHVRQNWGTIARNTGTSWSYKEFEFYKGFFDAKGISGGQAGMAKAAWDYRKYRSSVNVSLKTGATDSYSRTRQTLQESDLIASDYEKFHSLPYTEVEKYAKRLSKELEARGMTVEDFMRIFKSKSLDSLDSKSAINYSEVCNKIAELRGARLYHTDIGKMYHDATDWIMNVALSPMSKIEEIARLGAFIQFNKYGYTNSEIYQTITKTLFNYDLKSNNAKLMEIIIPFYNYECCNAFYWLKMINDNPSLLQKLEHFVGPLSWESAYVTEEDHLDNYDYTKDALAGNIFLDGGQVSFKLNPSFMADMQYIYGGPSVYFSKLSTPLQVMSKYAFRNLGLDTWYAFSDLDYSILDKSKAKQIAQIVPFGDRAYTIWDGFFNSNSTGEWTLMKDGLPKDAVHYFSSIFDFNKEYGSAGNFAKFKADLERQGKWWDENFRKVRPLSEKNSFGLNADWSFYNKDGEFDDAVWKNFCHNKWLYQGVIYDYNQRRFVSLGAFKVGMLNDPDISFEQRRKYMKDLFGLVWDGNQGAFVDKDHYISGGLNDKHNFTSFLRLMKALQGKEWINGELVKTGQPLVRYALPNGGTYLDRLRIEGIRDYLLDYTSKERYNLYKNKLKDEDGYYILTGNKEHDQKVFDLIMQEVSVNSGYNRYNYHRWSYKNYNFEKTPIVPKKKYVGGYTHDNKIYGLAYTFNNDTAALRMAVSGYKSYDEYYNFEYTYNYNYRKPQPMSRIKKYNSLRQNPSISAKSKLAYYLR